MPYQAGDSLFGFTVTRVRRCEELESTLVEMVFDKTGTKLCWVDNGEQNKLFCIAFKTLPEDDTGVFHILEHSVLCGSDKYPVREPFVELLKSSMNTFLNAMTYPDKTMYPVSSRNEQDFLNLTDVYLDAVFAPAILHNPNIFYQEGHHIEMQPDGTAVYKGVVFNEMKGATGGVDNAMEYRLQQLLFPDTCYGKISGGDPVHIPELTYEQFKAAYRRFYHPSNAYVFLDGSVPMDKVLPRIAAYLNRFDKLEELPEVALQTPKGSEDTIYYELNQGEELTGREQLAVGRILDTWQNRHITLAARILCDLLAGSNEAPLKRAVLSEGYAQDFDMDVDGSIAQSYFAWDARNIKDGCADELIAFVRKTALELAQKGFDPAAISASINHTEFRLREPDEPQGLDRCDMAMRSWLHGGDPLQYLTYDEIFAWVRKFAAEGGLEQLAIRLLSDDGTDVILHALPSYNADEEKRAAEAARLARTVEGWSEEDKAANALLNEKLQQWQQTPDSPEQLATLPGLSLSEVSPEPSLVSTEVGQFEGVRTFCHAIPCRGIVHFTLYFPLTRFTLEELTDFSMFTGMLGKLSTLDSDGFTLQQRQKEHLGRLSFSVDIRARKETTDCCLPQLAVRCSVLKDKLPEALALIEEILCRTKTDEGDKIAEMLLQLEEDCRQVGISSGHAIGMYATLSHGSSASAVQNAIGGYTMIRRLHELAGDLEHELDAYILRVSSLLKKAVNTASLTASISGERPEALADLLRALPHGEKVPESAHYESDLPTAMGCTIPAPIGFAVQGFHMQNEGFQYSGVHSVLAQILSLDHLWNTVRVQGGAYGAGMHIDMGGNMFTYSYRDPSPHNTLACNKTLSDFIKHFCEEKQPLEGYIISTIANDEPLRTPRELAALGDRCIFNGYTPEALRLYRRQMMETTHEQLLACLPLLDTFAQNGPVCVVGFEDMLNKCSHLTHCDL